MAWFLNPALTNFRNAVNKGYPNRDKASDGTIGDEAHQASSSDHNPDADQSVDAWDMDVNLYGAGKAPPAADIEHLKKVFQAHPSSQYWIHNRQIASRSNGWQRTTYTGPNPHDKHVHWNTREAYENSTTAWRIDMVTSADADLIVNRLLTTVLGSSGPNVGVALQSTYHLAVQIAGKVDIDETELAAIQAAAAAGVAEQVDEITAAVVAALPETGSGAGGTLTVADVETAVRNVFADAATP
jgi:hypothetical protein